MMPRVLLVLALAVPAVARGQALVPFRGEGAVVLGYQYFTGNDHLFSTDIEPYCTRGYCAHGDRIFMGDTYAHTFTLGVDYGVTHRLAAQIQVAYVVSSYEGRAPISLPIDNGSWHSSLQDLEVTARYQVYRHRTLWVTPFVGVTVPTHDYQAFGHAAPGARLRRLSAGTHAAAFLRLGPLPTFLEASYHFSYSEVVDLEESSGSVRIRPNRSLVQGAWTALPGRRWMLGVWGNYLHTHGGLDWTASEGGGHDTAGGAALHTRGSDASAFRLGGLFGYRPGTGWTVTVRFLTTVTGANVDDADTFLIQIGRDFSLTGSPSIQ